MPTWGVIGQELKELSRQQTSVGGQRDPYAPSPQDIIRRKYLTELANYTGHPVIVYASGWLEGRPVSDISLISVATRDQMGFMEATHDLPPGPLDLILHSPGGDPNAAKAIMEYLRDRGFGPIRAFVPILAMSAATMMALSCDEIYLARHSQLGPIDPQFTIQTPEGIRSAPAQSILDQFDQAKKECAAEPQSLSAWLPILRSYAPGLLSQCLIAQEAAQEMVAAAMKRYMFKDCSAKEAKEKATKIATWFNDHKTHRSHGRPLRFDDVKQQGVKVSLLENDNELQDKVLSAWHGIQLSLAQVAVNKIIENNKGQAWILSGSPGMQIMVGPSPQQTSPIPAAIQDNKPAMNRQTRRKRK